MTREDLLKGNAEIAASLGKDVRSYCPEREAGLVVIFNPADITGLVALIHSGLAPSPRQRPLPRSTAPGSRPRLAAALRHHRRTT